MAKVSIRIKGKPINLEVGILAFRLFCEDKNIHLEDLGKHLEGAGVFGFADMLYAAHEAYCQLNNVENEYSNANATMWLENLTEAQLHKFQQAVMDTKMFGTKLSEAGNVKKKAKQ